jgi:hypothetical protein
MKRKSLIQIPHPLLCRHVKKKRATSFAFLLTSDTPHYCKQFSAILAPSIISIWSCLATSEIIKGLHCFPNNLVDQGVPPKPQISHYYCHFFKNHYLLKKQSISYNLNLIKLFNIIIIFQKNKFLLSFYLTRSVCDL